MAEIQVLHVDDEPDMRLLVKLSLELDAGISTRSASSGMEALDATSLWRPDIILLDATMPGMDGIATLKALQSNPKTAGIPVLFLTGSCTASDIDSFKANGSAGVIGKPFNPKSLAAAIRGYVQTTAAATPAPDYFGRSSSAAGEENVGASFSTGEATMFGALGTTTDALLLDGSGNAFAITITDNTVRSTILPTAQQAEHDLTVHIASLDAATVNNILGIDADGLLGGDDQHAAPMDWTSIGGTTFKIDHAIGCAPSAVTSDVASDQSKLGIDVWQHHGSLSPSGDWASIILPRASMH